METFERNKLMVYHNDFSRVPLRKFTKIEMDLFMVICCQMREKGLTEITFTFEQLQALSTYSCKEKDRFVKDISNTYLKYLQLPFKIENERVIEYFVLFTKFKIDLDTETILIKVNTEFYHILNDLTKFFTAYDMSEYLSLSSSYAKELYRHLKRYKDTGWWKVSIEEFKYYLSVPESYKMSDIDKRVLNPSIKELKNIFKGLKVEKIKPKKNVTHLNFSFKKQTSAEKHNDDMLLAIEKFNYKKINNNSFLERNKDEIRQLKGQINLENLNKN